VNVYVGFVELTLAEVGETTTVVVEPRSGKIVASTFAEAKSCMNSIETELSTSPATRVFALEPNPVVSTMSSFVSIVMLEIWSLKLIELITTLASVRTILLNCLLLLLVLIGAMRLLLGVPLQLELQCWLQVQEVLLM
jgi:hypothetical protein